MAYNKSLFQGVPKKQVNKSRFNLSHEWKGQILPGYLVPCLLMEALPQDEWSIDCEFQFAFSPLYYPVMAQMTMRADVFFISYSMLWPYANENNVGWEKWIAQQDQSLPPTMSAYMGVEFGGVAENAFWNRLLAFMGLPITDELNVADTTKTIDNLSAFPLSAYLKIWDEHYRVPQLEQERWFPLDDGDNTAKFQTAFGIAHTRYTPLHSYWMKDYFTSALPTPQLGDAIEIPITDEFLRTGWVDDSGTPVTGALNAATEPTGEPKTQIGATDVHIDGTATIKQLREAETLQGYYERLLKVGQRYRDFIEGFWGVDPQPLTVDVPVLIGSRFGRVQVSDVLTTANSTGASNNGKTGDYRGNMKLYSREGGMMDYFCREHGLIMCILQVNPNTSYGQGIHRLWRRTVQTDYALDIFSTIGDQEILKEEVLYPFKTADDGKGQETFGYIPRFSEYRFQNNIQVGNYNTIQGRSKHLGRLWDQQTMAGANYDTNIQIDENFVKTFNVDAISAGIRYADVWRALPMGGTLIQHTSEGIIDCWIFHEIYVNRALPLYSTPKL